MRYLSLCFSAFCFSAAVLLAQQNSTPPSTELTQALSSSREHINSIDDQIVKLLNDRAVVVRQVGVIKKRYRAPASAPAREEQVLRRVAAQARAPLTPSQVEAIYKTILGEMSRMEGAEMEKLSNGSKGGSKGAR
ncbi:MAG: chorismate mutase [Bryobacterales bacterium]|nr:chorismate mutase [Bryobacterales bacterium]